MVGNVYAMTMCDEKGLLKKELVASMPLDDIQNLWDAIKLSSRIDEKNLETLKDCRDELALAEFEKRNVTTFDEGDHTYTLMPKSKCSAAELRKRQPGIWADITTNHADMLAISKGDLEDLLRSKGVDKETIEAILGEVSIPLESSVRVTRRK